jgi:hypothetical protein
MLLFTRRLPSIRYKGANHMAKYFEKRKPATNGSLSTDIMRHLHTRQHLGKAVVVCDNPASALSAARKQWLKLSRSVQKRRSSTLNADKILNYTHAVTHMQHMQFTTRSADDCDANVYFLTADSLANLPTLCFSVYLTTFITPVQTADLLAQLPTDALIADYRHETTWEELDLLPKQSLVDQVAKQWLQVCQFLDSYHIDTSVLSDDPDDLETMEEALDILLGAHSKFLQVAGDFQRTLELARPLRLAKDIRTRYDAAILLAHRVQALTPNPFTQSFLEAYDENDTFFLYDRNRQAARLLILDQIRRGLFVPSQQHKGHGQYLNDSSQHVRGRIAPHIGSLA